MLFLGLRRSDVVKIGMSNVKEWRPIGFNGKENSCPYF
ncbi:hypothetical protein CKC_03600 [Candidatus Liberibacter solanacearum CLso-ZC1]|uniref:Uncharacterized protein n=1 Tax=Liberibacter solanacearum (strain CLso-ZC1) TaxID=658172 RepID=E4UBG3_LIBSC|nr:hypothetical protein CKC_03600 [Candidatus Liberibacter solanacearum CLso-ZC1]